jgi:hypothetical protein
MRTLPTRILPSLWTLTEPKTYGQAAYASCTLQPFRVRSFNRPLFQLIIDDREINNDFLSRNRLEYKSFLALMDKRRVSHNTVRRVAKQISSSISASIDCIYIAY